jgi:hypothetical protein
MAAIDLSSPASGGGGGGGNLQLASSASMSATLTAVTDTSNVASPLKLSTTLVQTLSTLKITTSDVIYIDAEDNSGNNRFTVSRGSGSQLVTVDFASVPTALTTPVGAIRTATDGVNLANVMTFLENGKIGLGTDTPAVKFDVHSADAIVAQFNKTVSGNSYIQQLMAGTARWKHGFTTATGAFDIIDVVNALTRLSVLNTGQLKLNAYTSTSAFTGTTAGFLAFDASGNILSVTSPATSPAGTTGAVQFNNAGAFGADSTNFFWDDTNNRLGIGTATPTQILDLVRPSGQKGAIRFFNASDSENTIQSGATFRIFNSTGGTPAASVGFFQNANNQIGINTNNPTASLNVQGSGATSATTSLLVQDSAGNSALTITDDRLVVIGTTIQSDNFAIGQSNALLKGITQSGSRIVINYVNGGGARFSNSSSGVSTLIIGEVSENMVSFGGITSSFPALKRASNNLEVKNADDTFGAGLSVGAALNASAILQADSTTKGFLPPRMTTAEKNAIATPAAGLMVYDTTLNKLCVRTAAAWETITSI